MWRTIRICCLLLILVLIAGTTIGDRYRTTGWRDTLWVGVFPVNGDGSVAAGRYLTTLDADQFADIEAFFTREAEAYGVGIERPVRMVLEPPPSAPPPLPDPDAGIPARIAWSLRARYYTWRQATDSLADVRLFVLYHDPQHTTTVPDSLGMQKGLMGIVHAYAATDMSATNNIVIAHELLHTLGATDKYDPASGQPVFPQGYGEPDAEPRHPQRTAEIMAGRTALSPTRAEMPASFAEVVVGPVTATEINWLR